MFYREIEGLKMKPGFSFAQDPRDPSDYTNVINATSGEKSPPMGLFDESNFAPITSAEHASSVIVAMRARNRTVMVGSSTEDVLRREENSQIIAPPHNPTQVRVVR